MDCGTTSSKLAAFRAFLEHDRICKGALNAVREAAIEYDAARKAEVEMRQSKTRVGRKKLAKTRRTAA